VEEVLTPALRAGDEVVFDNLSSHLAPAVFEAIERAGAIVLTLPRYSPDFMPIEEMISKFKVSCAGLGPGRRSTCMTRSARDYRNDNLPFSPRRDDVEDRVLDCAREGTRLFSSGGRALTRDRTGGGLS
jgi:hypothetical protein